MPASAATHATEYVTTGGGVGAPGRGAPRRPAPALSAAAAAIAGRLADLLDAVAPAGASELAEATEFLRRMAGVHPPFAAPADAALPLDRLVAALALTELERDLVLLAGLPEEHEGYAAVLRRLHPARLPRATTGLAAQLLCPGAAGRDALRAALAHGAAATSALLRLGGEGPFSERTIELAPGLWSALALGPPPPAGSPADVPAAGGLQRWLAGAAVARAVRGLRNDERCTILVIGEDVRAAAARADVLVAAAGRASHAGTLAAGADGAAAGGVLALRALAFGAVPVLTLGHDQAERGAGGRAVDSVPRWHPGPLVLCARPGDAPALAHDDRLLLAVGADALGIAERRAMWAAALPELAGAAGELAARHAVEPAVAAQVGADARNRAWLDGRAPTCQDVAASTKARSSGALPAGVMLRSPRTGFGGLVLPEHRVAQLRAAVDRLHHQSMVLDEWGFERDRPGARGVRLLLAGPPGTGKTLSAEVLAHELGIDLMVVDISRILSKWIGETEQRLADVFDAAEPGHCVLLFDEADALFGRRTDVSDAHDRHANIETAYLLQRLERFEGMAVLTTNLRQNIDEAFTRRIEFVVDFDEPGLREREALWRAHVPAGAPVAHDFDPAELAARYPVVGGLIRNAAVAAAFLAAADGTAITREHALQALQREYEKHGRAFPGRPPDPLRTHPDPRRSTR